MPMSLPANAGSILEEKEEVEAMKTEVSMLRTELSKCRDTIRKMQDREALLKDRSVWINLKVCLILVRYKSLVKSK
jgi:hypothetical protein